MNISQVCYCSNIAEALLQDENFIRKYGETGRMLCLKIKAWLDVVCNRNVTLSEMETIFSMYIPHKKKFFKQLESIILNTRLGKLELKRSKARIKRDQLMIRLMEKRQRFYSTRAWIWHIKHLSKNHLFNSGPNILLKKRLTHTLVNRKVLNRKLINKLIKHQIIDEHLCNPYGLILRNIKSPEKIDLIAQSYVCNRDVINLCAHLKQKNLGDKNPQSLINNYFPNVKNSNQNSDDIAKFYCCFILMCAHIGKKHRKSSFEPNIVAAIISFLTNHEYFVINHFKGIGTCAYLNAMTILVKKLIHKMGHDDQVMSSKYSMLKQLVISSAKINNIRMIKALEDCADPYLNYSLPENFLEDFEDKNYLKHEIFTSMKKSDTKRKEEAAEFFLQMGIAAILTREFYHAITFLKTAFFFANNVRQALEEQIIYLIIFSIAQIIMNLRDKVMEVEKDGTVHKVVGSNKVGNTLDKEAAANIQIERLTKQLNYWNEISKEKGQITIYGQTICDLFFNNYRKTNHLVIYANRFYNSFYKNTIKKQKFLTTNLEHGSNDKTISKYDWLVFLGIHVLTNEKTDIYLEVIEGANGKKQCHIYNNKYSVSSKTAYHLDYIMSRLPKKALQSTTLLMRRLVVECFKKHHYMLMLGEAIEHKTGACSALTIHPCTQVMEPYVYEDKFDYRILSPIMQKESLFKLKVDGRNINIHTGSDASLGAGLFQINKSNAEKAAKHLKVAFNAKQLEEDIAYNFVIIASFIKNIQSWLHNKHIISFIIAYNNGSFGLRKWQQSLVRYHIPLDDPLFLITSLTLVDNAITRIYVNKLISNYNNSIYWQDENYRNVVLYDRRPVK